MDTSPFALLPGELRNIIWRYTLVESGAAITIDNKTKVPAILATCREIRQESYKIYFVENKFEVVVKKDKAFAACLPWFKRIGPQTSKLIQRLELRPASCNVGSIPPAHQFYENLVRLIRTYQPQAAGSHAAFIMWLLKDVRVQPNAVHALDPAEKRGWWDAEWSLIKEALDSKLEELKTVADEGEQDSNGELAALTGEGDQGKDAVDGELAELADGRHSGDAGSKKEA